MKSRSQSSCRVERTMSILFVCLLFLVGGSQCRKIPDGDSVDSPDTSSGSEKMVIEDALNEPDDSQEKMSFRLCPEDSAYHNETSKCYKLREKGPCGKLQLFYHLRDAPNYGECGCMTNSEGCTPNLDEGVSNRMILSGPDKKNCFLAFTQGPCAAGEWYVFNNTLRAPQCQKNPCCSFIKQLKLASIPEDPTISSNIKTKTDIFTFTKGGRCQRTYTQAFCKPGEFVQFVGTSNLAPKCYAVDKPPIPFCMFGVAPQVGMPCEAGYKLVGDDCVFAEVEFD